MKIMKANVINKAELASLSVKYLIVDIDCNASGTSYAQYQKFFRLLFF